MNKLLQKNNLNNNESKFNQLSNDIKFSLSSGGKSGNKNCSPAEMYINSLESKASKKTFISHLNWAVRALAQHQQYDLESVIDQEFLDRLYLKFDWTTLEMGHVELIKQLRKNTATLYRGHTQTSSPSSVNGLLTAIRGVAKKAVALGLMPYERLIQINDVKMDKGFRVSEPTILKEEEIKALLLSCANDLNARGIRDAAIIAAMLGCGLRRGDLGAIKAESYRNGQFRVVGKGNKEAILHLPRWAKPYVEEWLFSLRDPEIHGPMFCRIRIGEELMRKEGLSGEGVAWILEQRVKESKLLCKIKPHDLRHTFAERMRERGESLATIQDALRHSSPITTRNYLKNNDKTLEKAAARDNFELVPNI